MACLLDELLPVGADDRFLVDLLLFHEGVAQVVLKHLSKIQEQQFGGVFTNILRTPCGGDDLLIPVD